MRARLCAWLGTALLCSAAVHAAERDPLPSEKEGGSPIHMPKYEGVEQLLVLSNRWVVVATTNIAEVLQKIDELSDGAYFKAVEDWEKSGKAGRPNWKAYKDRPRLRAQFAAQARNLAGERKLDEPSFYAITSADDPRYKTAMQPKRVTRYIVSLGGTRVRGGGRIHYAHYSYLEMPQPLTSGRHYTITLGSGEKVTFLYDELRTVSRAIKVNQVGYLPDAGHKFAYLGAHLHELGPHDFSYVKEFKVVSAATGEVVHTGKVRLRERNPRIAPRPGKDDDPAKRPLLCGEDVYELDLGGLKAEGEFFISIPGVGRSWTFRHAPDVYGRAFYIACRGLYHQRCGIPLERKYTPWTRIKCHPEPVYECEHVPFHTKHFKPPKGYQIFDVIGGSIDTTRRTENVVGGWHDAADWDRNIYHYSCVFDLLNAYELMPAKFADGQLHLPESGNGIPDILDEAAFGLEVWKRSMDDSGAVSGMVETWTHPKIDDPKVKYAFSRRTRWSSLIFAAAVAQLAKLVKPFDQAKAGEWAALAKRAYAFGADPKNSLGKTVIHTAKNRGRGEKYTLAWEEKDAMNAPYLVHAKLRLYLLTGDKAFLDGMPELTKAAPPPFAWPYTYNDFSAWWYYDIPTVGAKVRGLEIDDAGFVALHKATDTLRAMSSGQPYRQTWPRHQDYWMGWGASDMTNRGRALLIAWQLTGDARYRDAAILNADFMLGANPMGMSWTTGLGFVYPIDIQHANSENDGILDPVPGITLYGITGAAGPATPT
ncbi:glycoside hydrolase family 9 protein [Planctomycetota bacterium]